VEFGDKAVSVCGRKAGRGQGHNECCSETKENLSWGMSPEDQRKVTLPDKLESNK
jgi:hypothetical protein